VKRISVFCGSSPGAQPEFSEAAQMLGEELVKRRIGLVYGGGRVGLMGEISTTVIQAGGEVIGVIPEGLVKKEIAAVELTDLEVVPSMHERKARMVEISDGFIALPGGLGTFEEIFEVLTWAQLGIHNNPCGFYNVNNYYGYLINFLDHAQNEQFIKCEHRQMIIIEEHPGRLLDRFLSYTPPIVDKAAWAKELTEKEEG
jgi:hypothetical protein